MTSDSAPPATALHVCAYDLINNDEVLCTVENRTVGGDSDGKSTACEEGDLQCKQ